MNEESIANQYSPIDNDPVDSSDNFEMSTSLNEEDGQQPERGRLELQATGEECRAKGTEDPGELTTEEPAESKVACSGQPNEDKNERKGDSFGLDDLQNDDISDDENFKDDELDFEEADNNSRSGCNEESLAKPVKQARAEDGEVNSEEELEDGEVKEEDSDEELDNLNDSGHHPANSNSNSNKPTPANLNALCRFYSKGLCTWGNSCRFVHDKPMGAVSYSPNSGSMLQPSPISKSNESLNQNKLNYQKYNPSNNPPPPPPPLNYSKPGSYYNPSADNQWDRSPRYVKKDQPPPFGKSYRSDEPDYDYPPQSAPRNRYQLMDERIPPSHQSSSYSRQTPYYTSKPHHQSPSQQSSSYNYRSSRGSQHAESGSYESEYERKRRLAFESAPWNEGSNNGSPRGSPVDRHSQSSSSSKPYKHHHPASSSYASPTASTFKKTDNAEHYLDPWRRSKSPFSGGSGSRSVGAGLTHGSHGQPAYHHSKSKSDSGSNFSNSESELIDSHKAKRLDPYYANKQRPSTSSYRESGNGELAPSYAPYDNPPRHAAVDHHAAHQSASSANKKLPYYNKPLPHHQPSSEPMLSDRADPHPPAASSYHHSAASASSYPKSTTPTNEMDIPNYERPKNPTRTRKDSWSDSDSCSTSTDSSYSASGSDSESNSDEPYSRTNKFESTREVGGEPQVKRQRTISDSRMSNSSKHDLSKPYSPTAENYSSSLSRYSSSSRKKQSNLNCEADADGLESSSQVDLERNGSGKHANSDSDGDPKNKAELLQQLKAIEEAIARKRSKLSH